MPANVEAAKNPNLSNTQSVIRPLRSAEAMRRAKALCAQGRTGFSGVCTGQIFIGLFFDGTGNNEKVDYIDVAAYPKKQKHSNVVRLYHTYPDEKRDKESGVKESTISGTNRYYSSYIPGVGTPFDEIKDDGGKLGTGFSWNGEPRIIWGMLSVLNKISFYVSDEDLISVKEAGEKAKKIAGFTKTAEARRSDFSELIVKLKLKIANRAKNKPIPEQINVSVFGFSRGAAEARAFVNWFFQICEKDGETHSLAGVPIRLEFLGIFDTVASVGIAGGFSQGMLAAEGHQSWANCNMQIHPAVESCLHIVAAHDVRSTFPVDSVRVDGKYPSNVTEYVFPGSHSDVGGGYAPGAQGKTDAIARIAGYEMYCAAQTAGVPLKALSKLNSNVRDALVPTQGALDAFNAYFARANIKTAPIEDMMRQHMAHYFTYRYQARMSAGTHPQAGAYYNRRFFKTARDEVEYLRASQQRFISVLANVVKIIDYLMTHNSTYDEFLPQPYQVVKTGSTLGEKALSWQLPTVTMGKYSYIFSKRKLAVDEPDTDALAGRIREKVEQWRKWLDDHVSPFLVDAGAPERDILSVVQSLSDQPQPLEMVEFFDNWVHDSMAGLHQDGADEFLLNGIGLAKFRRVYFGNRADAMTRQAATSENKSKLSSAKELRRYLAQTRLEAEEYARTR